MRKSTTIFHDEDMSRITNDVGADILVLNIPLPDTRIKAETLVGKFISDIVLQVLSFVTQNERENIKQRQAEGKRVARQNGVKFGRLRKKYTDEFIRIAPDYIQKRIPLKTALKLSDAKQNNFFYHIRKMKNGKF